MVTRSPRDFSRLPRLEAVRPFPQRGGDASGDEDVLGRLAIYQGGLPWAEGEVRSGDVSTGF
jgi:hypothetical protein